MNKKFIIVIAMSLFILAGCGATGQLASSDTVKIGVVAPLTGNLDLFGERILKGVEIAKDEINSNGGINGHQIELVYEDAKCQPQPTITSLQKLQNFDNIAGFIGPFCGSSIQVAAEFASANNLIGITPNNNYGKLSGNFFSVMSLVETEDQTLAEYAYNEVGLRKVGILYHDNYFGLVHRTSFRKHFEALGGEVTVEEGFGFSDTDFRTSLAKIGQDSDGIFIVYSKPGEIMNQLVELDLNLQVLGQWGMENTVTIQVAGANADGVVYAFPEVVSDNAFRAKFTERYDEIPSVTSSSAYDALNILAQLFTECQNFETECAVEKMMQLHYEGAAGTITFNPDTWDVGKKYVMKTIKDQQYVLV